MRISLILAHLFLALSTLVANLGFVIFSTNSFNNKDCYPKNQQHDL